MNTVSRLAGEEEVVTGVSSTGLQFTDINEDKRRDGSLSDGADNGNDDGDDDGYSANEGADLLCGSGSIASQGSVTIKKGFDGSLNVRSLGLDDICFNGEIGRWNKSWAYSPMMNAVEIRGGSTKKGTQDDEKVEFHAIITFVDKSQPLEVPEEYDRYSIDHPKSEVTGFEGWSVTWEPQGVG